MFNLNTNHALFAMQKGKHIISNYKRIYYMDKENNIRICDENKKILKIVDVEFFLKLTFLKFKEV
ncbi:MAG: hypothetical protein K2X69_09220 [Silvanigrellaceae bacterium]|nr:hypothetical protein [Silvanigrellaceae bacterium]